MWTALGKWRLYRRSVGEHSPEQRVCRCDHRDSKGDNSVRTSRYPNRANRNVSWSAARRNCVLPISQAGFTCERDSHIDSSDWTVSESDHLFWSDE